MTIKFGVIGAGKIVRVRHLPEIESNPHSKVAAICDVVKGRAQELAKKYQCKAFTDYHDMLKDPDIDAIIVAATNSTHAEMSIAASNAGKHVLCEKPMATNLSDAKKMIAAAKRAGRQLMIAHNQRLEPANEKAREIILSGKLGKVLTFTSIFGHPGSEAWAIDGVNTWFYRKDVSGLGVLGDLAIHKLDLVRWILDDDFTEASARIDTLSKKYPDGEKIDVEDNAICILGTAKQAMGTIIASWSYQMENNSTTFYCEKGVLELYGHPEYPLVIHFDNDHAEYHQLGRKSTNVDQIKSGIIDAFVEALINDYPVPISGIEGYKALQAVLACQQSAETGVIVKINKGELTDE